MAPGTAWPSANVITLAAHRAGTPDQSIVFE